MTELKRKGGERVSSPLNPKDQHLISVGTGNCNRFAPLLPPPLRRQRINSKPKLDDSTELPPPKTPGLDINVVFAQLKESEDTMMEIKKTLDKALSIGDNCNSTTDSGQGTICSNKPRLVSW